MGSFRVILSMLRSYKCAKCGLPKKGHVCLALTSNNNDDVVALSLKETRLASSSELEISTWGAEGVSGISTAVRTTGLFLVLETRLGGGANEVSLRLHARLLLSSYGHMQIPA